MNSVLLQVEGADAPIAVGLNAHATGVAEVTVDGRALAVWLERGGADRGRLRTNGRVAPYRVVRDGEDVHVWIGGTTWTLRIIPRTAQRAGDADAVGAANDLEAPMPGTILRINVPAGERFIAHQPLIVMESMKMEMTLSAPRAGTVREVLCAEGDLVEKGALLVRLDGDPDGAEPDAP